MTRSRFALDPRTWLVWWLAASLPALLGRNPFMLGAALMVIVIVRSTLQPLVPIVSPGIFKLFLIFAGVSVLFNALTVHAGNIEIVELPEWVPIISGAITLNAVIYGVLGALAILTLVLAGLTVAEQMNWATAMRLMPDSLLGLGAASSIAFAFFPQMLGSFREIREARALRGAPVRTPLDYAGLVAPALSHGLDRAVTLSELLEVRSFGGSTQDSHGVPKPVVLSGGIVALTVSAYFFVIGNTTMAVVLFGAAVCLAAIVMLPGRRGDIPARTRFRPVIWRRSDSFVTICAALSIGAIVLTLSIEPDAIRYEPYPDLAWPTASLPLILAICLLTAPALCAVLEERRHD